MPPPMSHGPVFDHGRSNPGALGPCTWHPEPIQRQNGAGSGWACRTGSSGSVLLGPVGPKSRQFKESCQIVRYETSAELEVCWPISGPNMIFCSWSQQYPILAGQISNTKMPRSAVSIDLEPVRLACITCETLAPWDSVDLRSKTAFTGTGPRTAQSKSVSCHSGQRQRQCRNSGGNGVTTEGEESFGNLTKSEYAS